MAEYVGALKDISALDLGAIAARAALARTGVAPDQVDHVVFGNVLQTSADAIYGARHVGLKAGVPVEVPALTVNRLCGSGIQAVISGAQMIQLGEADIVLTGGMENMSQAPHVIRGLRGGLRLGQGKLEDSLWDALDDTHCGCSMAETAENCAREVRHHARGAGRVRASQPAARGRRVEHGTLRRGGRARGGEDAQGRRGRRRATTTCGQTPRSRDSRSCRRRSARTGASPPATPAASSTARPRSCSPPSAAVDRRGLMPLARLARWADDRASTRR